MNHNANLPSETILVKNYSFAFFAFFLMFFAEGDKNVLFRWVARMMISRYPELKVYFTYERAWEKRYQQNMFDAKTLGIIGEN